MSQLRKSSSAASQSVQQVTETAIALSLERAVFVPFERTIRDHMSGLVDFRFVTTKGSATMGGLNAPPPCVPLARRALAPRSPPTPGKIRKRVHSTENGLDYETSLRGIRLCSAASGPPPAMTEADSDWVPDVRSRSFTREAHRQSL